MTRLPLIALLALAVLMPQRQAAAQDAIGGAIVGGVVGGLLGGAVGGRGGAAVGAVLGAGTGAAIAAEGERRGSYYYYRNACYLPQPDGTYVAVSPAYCDGAPPPQPQRYYSREVEAPRCTRSPTFDPRDGTFIDRNGYRRRCV
jgi:hypothetical protein